MLTGLVANLMGVNDASDKSPKNESPQNGSQQAKPTSKAYTPKKGYATPKRKDAQATRGTFEARYAPAESFGEHRKKRKELKASMSSEEWKAYKQSEKEARRRSQREAQAAMDRGDERYLLQRDQGPERRFIRDYVDARRYMNNWVMPFALILLVLLLFGQRYQQFGAIVSTIAMFIMLIFFAEGVWLGRSASRATKAKFPKTTQGGFAMGFYAYGRATQPRRWRSPRPMVALGDKVE